MSHFNKSNSVWGKGGGGIPPNMMGQGMMPFQQQQMYAMGQQNVGMGMHQIYHNMNTVSYPNSRNLNSAAFQQPGGASGAKERVFTGTVTQIHDNFGFIDDEVFFPRNVCDKGSNPMVGDLVLVDATFNATMPFKWNASRVQVLQPGDSSYRDQIAENGNDRYGRRDRSKASAGGRGREREHSRDRGRAEDEVERKRRREERVRERDTEDRKAVSPVRRRSRSPKRRFRPAPRYFVQIPKISLDLQRADVFELKRRYLNLYIPSDFFTTQMRWSSSFPAEKPLSLNKPGSFHIMHKEVDSVHGNDAILDPEDVDYTFCAKVMLISLPGIEELYRKTCPLAEDRDKKDRDSEDKDLLHPSKMINFLVGLKGKNESMAIGGPWSPSLDGPDPDKNPMVLIKTAIRTCKGLTGIDLSSCTQWYRFLEVYYHRGESTHKGKTIPARVETTVIFLPDVWSCMPSHAEWETRQQVYREHYEGIIKANEQQPEQEQPQSKEDDQNVPDEKDEASDVKTEPTTETKSPLGVKVTKNEKKDKPDSSKDEVKLEENDKMTGAEDKKLEDNKKHEVKAQKKLDEKEKHVLERRYTLPRSPHIIVHPSKTAKAGKFVCHVMSLSHMLDYRPEDAKEHSFEVSLFAEQFNEMLIRDFGFNIFRAIFDAPEKSKEDDKRKKEEKDKKVDDKKKKGEEKKEKKVDEKEKVEGNDDKESKKEGENITEDNDDQKVIEIDGEKPNEKTEVSKDAELKDKKDEKEGSKKSDDSGDEDNDDKKERKDRKKKERVKLVTKDKHLMLSFVYFDQSHCGYIYEKDIEELLLILGVQLSRAQIKKLVSKVISRDSLHYWKLTDKPKDEPEAVATNENLKELLSGNKKLLPIFDDGSSPKSSSASCENVDGGIVTYRGAVVNIEKLLHQLERNEVAKIDIEERLENLKSENIKLTDKYSKTVSNIKHLSSEIKELKEKLRTTEDSLDKVQVHSKLLQTTLVDVRDKINPVLKVVLHKEESKREKEKDVKQEKDDITKEKGNDTEKIKKETKADIKEEISTL